MMMLMTDHPAEVCRLVLLRNVAILTMTKRKYQEKPRSKEARPTRDWTAAISNSLRF